LLNGVGNLSIIDRIYGVSPLPAPNKQIKALAWEAYRNQIDREKLINQFEFQAMGVVTLYISIRSLV